MTGPARSAGARSTLLLAATGYAVARAARAAHLTGRFPGGSARWDRVNHAGDTITLTEGVALAAGTGLPLVLADPPAALAVSGAALAGAADDLGESIQAKGLRGHLSALRAGRVTTGAVKVGAIGATGLVTAAWSDHRHGRGVGLHTIAAAGLVAGGANLANLFDLRPGRALKVGLVCGIPLLLPGRPAAATAVGASLAVLPDDLAARSMLGDTGANPLGAAVGTAAAQRLPDRGRWTALAVVTGLTLLSERVSFTRVIESTPVLRSLDAWGRG